MQRVRLIAWVVIAVIALAGTAVAKDKPLRDQYEQFNTRVETLRTDVDKMLGNLTHEIDERDRLMLRRRFVEGREFFYELHDYRGATEVFYSIVNHPLAGTLPNEVEAMFYLAESLFRSGFLREAEMQYQQVMVKGAGTEFYPTSLIRRIEIAVEVGNYTQAESLYAVMLSQLPAGEDGSLGRYIIGKSYFTRGETAKAIEVFDSIPETGSYYATAQYYVAVILLKQKNYREAVNRLRSLKKVLKEDVANKQKLYALTHLALARIYYELNDFPQAMANYAAVPADTDDYPEALYESIWVFITRNDYLLKAVEDERSNFESLLFETAGFQETVEVQSDQETLTPIAEETAVLQGELDAMSGMFEEIDGGLARLQEEAIASFNKLVEAAPKNSVVPRAELLVGNIYSQVEEYQKAEDWFNQLKRKYADFHASVSAARPRMDSGAMIELVQDASTSFEDGSPLTSLTLRGMPEEVAYWLVADKDVQQTFALYDAVNYERANVNKMRELVGEIERDLRDLETGVEVPFLRETARLQRQYLADIQSLQVEIVNLRNAASASTDDEMRAEIATKSSGYEATLSNLQSRLVSVEPEIEAKKRERLDHYRQQLVALQQPISDFDRAVESLRGQTGNVLAQVAAAELAGIETQIAEYAQQADLGIIDVAYRTTRGSSREMRKLQHEMEKELRELRRQQREIAPEGDTPPPENPPQEEGDGS